MENSYDKSNGNGPISNGHVMKKNQSSNYQQSVKGSLACLDLRVFYVRVSKCEIDDSTPAFLTLNHIPMNPDTLLEVNGVRNNIHSDEASILLRRDRLDKKSEEATFVSTDSVRMTGSVKFEVFDKDTLVLSYSLNSTLLTRPFNIRELYYKYTLDPISIPTDILSFVCMAVILTVVEKK